MSSDKSHERRIPFYNADGTSLGTRTFEAAKSLVDDGSVKALRGRKGNLQAIIMHSDGSRDPVQTRPTQSTLVSLPETQGHEHGWKVSRLEGIDENGKPFRGRFRLTPVITERIAA